MVRVLMVCMGNICRSPMAEAVAQHVVRLAGLAKQWEFDSAGTHAAHTGARSDARAQSALEGKGYAMSRRRARAVVPRDFERFDLILAMDHDNLANLRRLCPAEHAHKVGLFLDLVPELHGQDVPDPYYGNIEGFARVLTLCEAGVRGLLASPRTRSGP